MSNPISTSLIMNLHISPKLLHVSPVNIQNLRITAILKSASELRPGKYGYGTAFHQFYSYLCKIKLFADLRHRDRLLKKKWLPGIYIVVTTGRSCFLYKNYYSKDLLHKPKSIEPSCTQETNLITFYHRLLCLNRLCDIEQATIYILNKTLLSPPFCVEHWQMINK